MDLILYKSSDLKPLSALEVLGEFATNRFGKYFPVAVISEACVCIFFLEVLDMNKLAMKTNKQTMKTEKSRMS